MCRISLLKQLRDDFGAKVVRDIRNAIGANPSYSLLVSCHSNLAVFDENLAGWPIKDDVSAKQLITEHRLPHLKYCVTEGTQTHTQEACVDGRRPRSDEQPEQQCAQDETAQTQERVDGTQRDGRNTRKLHPSHATREEQMTTTIFSTKLHQVHRTTMKPLKKS